MLSSPTAVKLLYRFWRIQCIIKKELFCKRNTMPCSLVFLNCRLTHTTFFLNANSNNFLQSIRNIVYEKQAIYEGAFISESDSAKAAKPLPAVI